MARFGQGFIQSLTQPSYMQGLFELGQAAGSFPGRAVEEKKKNDAMALVNDAVSSNDPAKLTQAATLVSRFDEKLAVQLAQAAQKATMARGQQAALSPLLSGSGMNDPKQLLATAQSLNSLGMTEQAVKLAQQAQSIQKFNTSRETTAQRAEALKLTDVAKNARSAATQDVLDEINADLRRLQIEKLPKTTPAVRKTLAQQVGINPLQFGNLDLANASEDDFTAVLEGQKGKIESWMDADGNIKAYRVLDSGIIYDDETGRYESPASLNLTQAPPQVQKVEQTYQGLKDELVKEGIKGYSDLKEQATDAQNILDNVQQVRPLLAKGTFGFGAEQVLFLKRLGTAIGLPFEEDVVSTEQYISLAATRIAARIKDFGAGTGLSDADREFAAVAEAGKIPQNPEALRRLLNIAEKAAIKKVELYENTTSQLRKALGKESDVLLSLYAIPEPVISRESIGGPTAGTPPPPPGFNLDN